MPVSRVAATCRIASGFTLMLSFGSLPVNSQIVVDDSPLEEKDTLAHLPLIAYRKIPDDAIAKVDASNTKWVLSPTVVLTSANADPQVSKDYGTILSAAREHKKSSKIEAAIKAYSTAVKNMDSSKDTPVLAYYKPAQSSASQTIDAVAIREMFDSGATLASYGQKDWQRGVPLDATFAQGTKQLYETIAATDRNKPSTDDIYNLATATQMAQADTRVASATLVRLVDIRIGNPLVYPAKDKKLILEPSIASQYDVYWIEFVVSPGFEAADQLSELFFLVTLQVPSAIALELVPLRFGTEQSIKQTGNTPEVTIEASGGKVTVGKVYEQSIEYKQLKPTVLATGLHESQFGWQLKGEIIDASSKRLIAIVGVPKQTREVPATLAVNGTLKSWGWFQSQKASTEPKFCIIKVHS